MVFVDRQRLVDLFLDGGEVGEVVAHLGVTKDEPRCFCDLVGEVAVDGASQVVEEAVEDRPGVLLEVVLLLEDVVLGLLHRLVEIFDGGFVLVRENDLLVLVRFVNFWNVFSK